MFTNYIGDLLHSKASYIVHQVNCQGAMNSGVAKCIREKFPVVFAEYNLYCKSSEPSQLLGNCLIVPVWNGQAVANLFGQNNFGYDGKQYTNYEALESALNILRIQLKPGESIAFPYKMACDRGGADWKVVFDMITAIFKDFDVEIWRL